MFQRFHAMKEKEEGGFTLIELLVVILIIAILAAIAIPVFLNQRKKGYVSQMESAAKNAATAAESYATSQPNGNYAGLTESGLTTEGWRKASAVTTVDVNVNATDDKYCVTVGHLSLAGTPNKYISISSDVTTPTKSTAACTGGTFTAATWTP
jgi:prepilin-type N-terminal cleavage/methylation domain-containing protein